MEHPALYRSLGQGGAASGIVQYTEEILQWKRRAYSVQLLMR